MPEIEKINRKSENHLPYGFRGTSWKIYTARQNGHVRPGAVDIASFDPSLNAQVEKSGWEESDTLMSVRMRRWV